MLTLLGDMFVSRGISFDYEIIVHSIIFQQHSLCVIGICMILQDDGTTPLKVAAEINAVEAVEYLLERHASPDGNPKVLPSVGTYTNERKMLYA